MIVKSRKPVALAMIAGLVLFVLSTATAHAQTRVGEKIGDWTFQCQAISAKDTVCAIAQVFGNQQTQQPVLVITLRPIGVERRPMLFARAPLGIFLPSPLVGKIDQGAPFNLAWQRCTNQGCEASVEINQTQRAAMKAGKVLQISFTPNTAAKPATFNVSLKGVTQGLKEIGAE